MSDSDEVWCLTCRAMFNTQEATAVVEFAPQGVTLEADGTFDLGYPSEAHMDYVHLTCGTKVRFAGTGEFEEEDDTRKVMVEVDAPGGVACVLMMDHLSLSLSHLLGQGGTDLFIGDVAHEAMRSSRQVMARIRDEAFSKHKEGRL
jgi:hypothetical protein